MEQANVLTGPEFSMFSSWLFRWKPEKQMQLRMVGFKNRLRFRQKWSSFWFTDRTQKWSWLEQSCDNRTQKQRKTLRISGPKEPSKFSWWAFSLQDLIANRLNTLKFEAGTDSGSFNRTQICGPDPTFSLCGAPESLVLELNWMI